VLAWTKYGPVCAWSANRGTERGVLSALRRFADSRRRTENVRTMEARIPREALFVAYLSGVKGGNAGAPRRSCLPKAGAPRALADDGRDVQLRALLAELKTSVLARRAPLPVLGVRELLPAYCQICRRFPLPGVGSRFRQGS
jgi:hypothetical protein